MDLSAVAHEPWRLRAPVTTYNGGVVWYPDIRNQCTDSDESPQTSDGHSPFHSSSSNSQPSERAQPSPFQAQLAAQVEACTELMKRTVSLARPDTTSFTHWALDNWLNDVLPPGAAASGTEGTPDVLPPRPASTTSLDGQQPETLLALMQADAAADPLLQRTPQQHNQQHYHHHQQHQPQLQPSSHPAAAYVGQQPGTGAPPAVTTAVAANGTMSTAADADLRYFQTVPLAAAAAAAAAAASGAAAAGGGMHNSSSLWGGPRPSTCATAAGHFLGTALSDPVRCNNSSMMAAGGRLAPGGLMPAYSAFAAAAGGGELQAGSQDVHQQQPQPGEGLTIRLGKKQRSTCDLSTLSRGCSPAPSPQYAPQGTFRSSSNSSSAAFAFNHPRTGGGLVGSPVILGQGPPASPLGVSITPGALSPVGTPAFSSSTAADTPMSELPRLSVQELCRLWHHKLQKLQQLLDCYTAATQVCVAAAAAEGDGGQCGLLGSLSGPILLLHDSQMGVNGALTSLVSPRTPGRSSSTTTLGDPQLTPTRKRSAAVLDLSQPADGISAASNGGLTPASSPQPGTPVTPATSYSALQGLSQPGTPLGPRTSSAGTASWEAAKQLKRIQTAVTDLVSFSVVLMTAALPKWQALLELDVGTGQAAAPRQLRGHWPFLLGHLGLLHSQQQRLLGLLRTVRDTHISISQRCSVAQAEELTRRMLLEVLTPLQAAQLLVGAAPGALDAWEVLLLMDARCCTSRQVTTCN